MGGLSALSVLFVFLSYAVTTLFIVGFLAKIFKYATTPAPLKISTTPAPTSRGGVAARLLGELLLFTSLFRGNKWTWIGGYLFHFALALVLLRHLRYFLVPVPELVSFATEVGIWAGVLLPITAIYLFLRRVLVDRLKYISTGADYFVLILIGLIAITGLVMKFSFRADITSVKEFMVSLISLSPVNIPMDPVFILHLTLVLVLMAYFPFSKLIHMGGVFFSPSRNQVDNSRDVRHVNPWAKR